MPRDDDTHPGGGTPPPASVASSPTLPMLEPLRAPDDRYEVTRELARGGIGRVLEARDRRLDRTVAVKELLSHDRETEARFARESQLTGQLEHPSIVPVHDAGHWSNGKPYYVMKRVTGRSLLDCIRETRTPAERMALLPKVIAVAEVIVYAHS